MVEVSFLEAFECFSYSVIMVSYGNIQYAKAFLSFLICSKGKATFT